MNRYFYPIGGHLIGSPIVTDDQVTRVNKDQQSTYKCHCHEVIFHIARNAVSLIIYTACIVGSAQ